ncbi:MAG: sulfotransferase domain-containing protein [Bacteroidota bacterium]
MSEIEGNREYLIIAGTPKSGSTYLFSLLAAHPSICASAVKETHYFLSEDHPLSDTQYNFNKKGIAGFLTFFTPRPQNRFLLEASVQLFSDSDAPQRLQQLGDCRLIFVLRSPAERLRSSFYFSKNNLALFKKELSFEAFVDCILEDNFDLFQTYLRKNISGKILFGELETGHYSKHLTTWQQHFDKNKIYLIQYEKMIQAKEKMLRALTQYLGIDTLPTALFEKANQNATQAIQANRLHYFIKSLSNKYPNFLGKTLIKNWYYRFQTKAQLPSILDDTSAMQRLKAHYQPLNLKLGNYPEIDLSLWK